ncbi:MAG TPA: hypothetical protein VEO54_31325 [Thermoanaerobaculia bacterium]|nr:hypothetical protein [Thermoanaerobaculia bacterium]
MEGGIYTGGRAVQSDECAEVQDAWTTPSEIIPPDEDTGIPHVPLEQGFGLDPLILDLNGDGIITTSPSWPVSFDLDGDGVASNMAWTNPFTEEGFLWVDLSPNGRVDDGRELFGTGTMMPSGQPAPDGFQALAIYDRAAYGGNDDWWIDRSDRIWGRLRVWVDRNHDGISAQDEIAPIHAHGVLGIDVRMSGSRPRTIDANGNTHLYQLTFLRRDRSRIVEGAIHCLTFAAPDP